MPDIYRQRVYPLLERIDPERSHHLALRGLSAVTSLPGGLAMLGRLAGPSDARLQIRCFDVDFPNPVGVAAGLDKDGEAVAGLFALGFGAVEVGTVTPRPQPGNPPPRLWRFPKDGALINAMGFPSQGAAAVRKRLVGRRFPGVVGINLGKDKETPAAQAAEDYVDVMRALWDVADYLTVNVSSPNTPGLRDLQRRDALAEILRAVGEANETMAQLHNARPRPVLVKIAPDLDDRGLEEVLAGSLDGQAAGLIVSNTTTDRSGLRDATPDLPGGLSGLPLRQRATALVREVRRRTEGAVPIIGVGGIASADDVIERMRAGASLVQIYTGFIYGGPARPGQILRDLLDYLDREGLGSINDLVGAEA